MSFSHECVLGGEQPGRIMNRISRLATRSRLARALHPGTLMRAVLTALILLALVSPTASAVSLDQIVALCRAGVSDDVVLALIDRDKPVFSVGPEQLVALKQAGVSDVVVMAILKSGHQPPPQPETTPATLPAIGPEIIIVGHGPALPNTAARHGYTAGFRPETIVLSVPYLLVIPAPSAGCAAVGARNARAAPVVPSFGRFMSDPTARFINNGFIPVDRVAGSGSAVLDCPQPPARSRPPQDHR